MFRHKPIKKRFVFSFVILIYFHPLGFFQGSSTREQNPNLFTANPRFLVLIFKPSLFSFSVSLIQFSKFEMMSFLSFKLRLPLYLIISKFRLKYASKCYAYIKKSVRFELSKHTCGYVVIC